MGHCDFLMHEPYLFVYLVGRLKSIPPICIMTLTVSQGEGMMVITITSNPKSKWPALCQILSSLCYGPVCFASEESDMKEKLTDTQRVIGVSESLELMLRYVSCTLNFAHLV